MSRLRVVPIVEGHGECIAVPILLRRIWTELLGGEFIDVLRPIRQKRQRIAANKDEALTKAVNLAASKLNQPRPMDDPGMILILIDADKDLPCVLGPQLLATARIARTDLDIACVLAKIDYETWFVAAAYSLSGYLTLAANETPPHDPEAQGCGKGWFKQRFRGHYSPTVDQPKLTARMDLHECRTRAPSFDKLCRDLEARLKRT